MIPFRKIHTGDETLDRIQVNVEQALLPLLRAAPNDGALLERIALSQGVNDVPHGLGRALRGWQLVRVRTPTMPSPPAFPFFYDSNDSLTPKQQALFLRLVSPAVVSVDIWVF